MKRPSAGQRHRNTMQHHDPVGTPGGRREAAPDALKAGSDCRGKRSGDALAVDLDARTSISRRACCALTDRRLLARDPANGSGATGPTAPGLALAPPRPRRRRARSNCWMPTGRLARWRFTLGAELPACAAAAQAVRQRRAGWPSPQREQRTVRAARRRWSRPGRPARSAAKPAHAAVDLGAAAPRALRQALPRAAAGRLPADAGVDRRHAGAALPDHAADGQRPDPVPERAADRPVQGRHVPGRPAGRGAGWPGRWAGPAPTCWRWCPSASAPTCAPPPTNTCCAVARLFRRQAHRRPDVAHRLRNRPHLRVPVAARCWTSPPTC